MRSRIRTPNLSAPKRNASKSRISRSSLPRHPRPRLSPRRRRASWRRGASTDALDLLRDAAARARPAGPASVCKTGETCQRMARWREAEGILPPRRRLDPENPHAFVGLARVLLLARRQWCMTPPALALTAIQRLHHYPLAHFLPRCCAAAAGRARRAAGALRNAALTGFWPATCACPPARKARAGKIGVAPGPRPRAAPAPWPWPREKSLRRRRASKSWRINPACCASLAAALKAEAVDFPPGGAGPAREPFGAEAITIVTGSPRSGTSLLMRKCWPRRSRIANGQPARRDEDNPKGYCSKP